MAGDVVHIGVVCVGVVGDAALVGCGGGVWPSFLCVGGVVAVGFGLVGGGCVVGVGAW